VVRLRPEPYVDDPIRALRHFLKSALCEAYGLRCVSIEEEIKMDKPPHGVDDIWQRRATAAAILAVREVIRGGTVRPATPIAKLDDIEIGWLFAASLFAWIRTRAEQATAEGWDTEETLRRTSLAPEPWDAGAVSHVLPELGALPDFDWSQPVTAWPKDTMVRFLLEAMKLISRAKVARDVGGSITTRPKSLDAMQRIAAAEAGGPLMTPAEFDDDLPF
jgi:hypothetical protein